MVKSMDFSRLLSVFQVLFKANFIFKDFLRQSCIFKYFSSLCEPCYPTHIDTISMELSILYLKGLPVKITSIKLCIYVPEDCFFFLANSADPDEMPPYAAIHLGHNCLPKNLYRMKRVR